MRNNDTRTIEQLKSREQKRGQKKSRANDLR